MMRSIIFAIIFALFFPLSLHAGPAGLRIHFLDAGEGDAVLITTASGESALIDCGNLITGHQVSEYIKKQNIRILNHLILTHYDPDHIGGAFFIAQELGIERAYDNGQNISGLSDMHRWYESLIRKNQDYRALRAGTAIELDKEVMLQVLWPPENFSSQDSNANCLVLLLTYNKFRCLLMADAPYEVERKLLAQRMFPRVDILKVGHHGAADATSESFLAATRPHIAVISVNASNLRGYPAEEVLERLENSTVKVIYRTDIAGDIIADISLNREEKIEIKITNSKQGKD